MSSKVDNKAIIGIIARFYKFMTQEWWLAGFQKSELAQIIMQFFICGNSFSQLSPHYSRYAAIWDPDSGFKQTNQMNLTDKP